jgi:hypothetical protein
VPLDAALEHLAQRVPSAAESWDALRSLGPLYAAHGAQLARLDPPEIVRARWARDLRATRAANLVLSAELARVLAALHDAGIDALVYKGAAALDGLYGDPGFRPMDDADLLVRPDDRERVTGLLGDLGFAPLQLEVGRLGTVGLALHGARGYRRALGALHADLDLHWHAISDARLRAAFPLADDAALWRRARPTTFGGAPALALDPVDAAIVTAASQLLGHPWSHPLGYLDLHLVAERLSGGDWEVLVQRAHARGLTGPAYWGLRFAAELFGTTATGALAALRPSRASLWLGERLVGGDWLGLAAGRREQPARDLFVLLAAGPVGALRLARATLVESRVRPASTANTLLWLMRTALTVSRPRPLRDAHG